MRNREGWLKGKLRRNIVIGSSYAIVRYTKKNFFEAKFVFLIGSGIDEEIRGVEEGLYVV